jgi:putative hemolysin
VNSVLAYLAAFILATVCSGSETAFSAAGRIKIAAMGKKGARALWFLDKPSRYLATTLVGTNVGVVLASSISQQWGAEMGGAWTVILAFGTALFLLIFAEIIPKQLALFRSNRLAVASAFVLYCLRMALYPLIASASGLSNLIAGTGGTEQFFESREEVRGLLLSAGGRKGKLASGVIRMADDPVDTYAKKLTDFPGVTSGASRDEAVKVLQKSEEDFILVWEQTGVTLLGAVRGAVLVRWDNDGSITRISSGLPYFDKYTAALNVLSELWRSGAKAAVVLDENGQPGSLVTSEMILNHLIPEISS